MRICINWITALTLVLGLWAAYRNFVFVDDAGLVMLHGGVLTGPMMDLSLAGSAIFAIGAYIQVWRRKIGGIASVLGFALMLPLFSWFFAAGVWCLDGKCASEYPPFTFHLFSAVTIVLAVASLVLQWLPRRP